MPPSARRRRAATPARRATPAGAEVTDIRPGDRVVIPFNIACGHCFM